MLFQKRETLNRHGCVRTVLGPIAELRAIMRTDLQELLFFFLLRAMNTNVFIGNGSCL